MSTHDLTILPTVGLLSVDRSHTYEVGDLFMRQWLSRYKGWPNTLTGGRPSVPTNYHINRITAPVIDTTDTTQAASYEIYDPLAIGGAGWVDISNIVLSRATAYFAGVDIASVAAATAGANAALAAVAAIQTTANAAMPRLGGTFTGPVTLYADATQALHPVAYEQLQAVQTVANAALPVAGGTMTGSLTLAADPTLALQSATKNYVDVKVAGVAGGIGIVTPTALNLLVQSTSLITPPGSPTVGQSWFIPGGTVPTGLWSGHAKTFATWGGSVWAFVTLTDGALLLDGSTTVLYMALGANPLGIVPNSAVYSTAFGAV